MLFQTLLSTVEQKNKIFQIMFQLYSESGSGERSTQIKILSTEKTKQKKIIITYYSSKVWRTPFQFYLSESIF